MCVRKRWKEQAGRTGVGNASTNIVVQESLNFGKDIFSEK